VKKKCSFVANFGFDFAKKLFYLLIYSNITPVIIRKQTKLS